MLRHPIKGVCQFCKFLYKLAFKHEYHHPFPTWTLRVIKITGVNVSWLLLALIGVLTLKYRETYRQTPLGMTFDVYILYSILRFIVTPILRLTITNWQLLWSRSGKVPADAEVHHLSCFLLFFIPDNINIHFWLYFKFHSKFSCYFSTTACTQIAVSPSGIYYCRARLTAVMDYAFATESCGVYSGDHGTTDVAVIANLNEWDFVKSTFR